MKTNMLLEIFKLLDYQKEQKPFCLYYSDRILLSKSHVSFFFSDEEKLYIKMNTVDFGNLQTVELEFDLIHNKTKILKNECFEFLKFIEEKDFIFLSEFIYKILIPKHKLIGSTINT